MASTAGVLLAVLGLLGGTVLPAEHAHFLHGSSSGVVVHRHFAPAHAAPGPAVGDAAERRLPQVHRSHSDHADVVWLGGDVAVKPSADVAGGSAAAFFWPDLLLPRPAAGTTLSCQGTFSVHGPPHPVHSGRAPPFPV